MALSEVVPDGETRPFGRLLLEDLLPRILDGDFLELLFDRLKAWGVIGYEHEPVPDEAADLEQGRQVFFFSLGMTARALGLLFDWAEKMSSGASVEELHYSFVHPVPKRVIDCVNGVLDLFYGQATPEMLEELRTDLMEACEPPAVVPLNLPPFDPMTDSPTKWRKRAAGAATVRMVEAQTDALRRNPFVVRTAEKRELTHFKMLADYQVGGLGLTALAKKYRLPAPAVSRVIRETAALIRMPLRKRGRPGRPRKS